MSQNNYPGHPVTNNFGTNASYHFVQPGDYSIRVTGTMDPNAGTTQTFHASTSVSTYTHWIPEHKGSVQNSSNRPMTPAIHSDPQSQNNACFAPAGAMSPIKKELFQVNHQAPPGAPPQSPGLYFSPAGAMNPIEKDLFQVNHQAPPGPPPSPGSFYRPN